MAVESLENKCFGVQFHPESILTPWGKVILKRFLEIEH
jgi:anthranilate synthase component 2